MKPDTKDLPVEAYERWLKHRETCPVCREAYEIGNKIKGEDRDKAYWMMGFMTACHFIANNELRIQYRDQYSDKN